MADRLLFELTPAPARYGLAGPAGQADQLATLTRLLCALDEPAQLWHGPRPVPTGGGGFLAELAAAARPRATLLAVGTGLAGRLAGTAVLRPSPRAGGSALPQVRAEWASAVRLADGRLGRVLALTTWPATVTGDWLAPIAADPAMAAVALHLQPLPAAEALRLLRRRLSGLLSTAAVDAATGEVPDPALAAAAEAARELAAAVARGTTALLRAQVLVGLVAADADGLAAAQGRVCRRLAGAVAAARVLRFEQRRGWQAVTPAGPPARWPWRVLDAASLAATIPHPTGLPAGGARRGVLTGVEPDTGSPVLLDRFALPNPTRLVVGTSGAGKSFAARLELLRWCADGADAVVVDPEGEFGQAGRAIGGLVLAVGEDPAGLDPVGTACHPDLAPTDGLGLLASLAAALSGGPLSAPDLALLDRALADLRGSPGGGSPGGGATGGGATGPARLVAAVARLAEDPLFRGSDLPARLAPAAAGSLGTLFAPNDALAHPPSVVVFDLRAVPGRVRPAVTACVLGWAWVQARRTGRPRLLVVDEAHLLLDDPAAAELLAQFARRSRKYQVALEVLTQRLSDFLGCPAGQAVLANAATILLLGCADHERAVVAAGLGLTAAEAELLRPGTPGRGLLIAGGIRTPVQVLASAEEAPLAAAGPRP
ncbi:MAG: VirB4 family type IV secretion system protein [Mycobacteriales bacterium]